jgi:hypothetical protein
MLRAVNSAYAKPIKICELNVAFFLKRWHKWLPFSFEGLKEPMESYISRNRPGLPF